MKTVNKQSLGRITVVPKGEYSMTTQYSALDLVIYGSSSYLAKQDVQGINPTNTEYWQLVALGGAGTPTVDSNGILSWPTT